MLQKKKQQQQQRNKQANKQKKTKNKKKKKKPQNTDVTIQKWRNLNMLILPLKLFKCLVLLKKKK